MEQKIISTEDNYKALDSWIAENRINGLMLVCDTSLPFLEIKDYFEELERKIRIIRFNDFRPNPLYESVVKGVAEYRNNGCNAIIAVGGGSAMDVAKCIKLYSNMEGTGDEGSFLKQTIVPNAIPFLAVPTTAGTGSEATRYAVIYYEGKKQSVTDYSCIPGTVLLDPSTLKTLPLYQKKSTMLDALCHAIESFWSVNSTEESRKYSEKAIELIMANKDGYLANDDLSNAKMLLAANTAGKAINITQTTAGHAMCYKITSLFGYAHGHAAALCDRVLYPWMIENTDKCIDSRGEAYLKQILDDIGKAMGCKDARKGAEKLKTIFEKMELEVPVAAEQDYLELKTSVNPVRLKNHPIMLDENTIDMLYHEILG